MKHEDILFSALAATRKVYGIPTGELKSTPDFADLVNLPYTRIRTDELPKVLVFGIMQLYDVPRNVLEKEASCILTGSTRQQNTVQYNKYAKKWDALMAHAHEDIPGVRRAMIQLGMILKNMKKDGYMKTVYHV